MEVVLFLSTFSQENSLLEITMKLGTILRYVNIFRVSELTWIVDRSEFLDIVREITDYAQEVSYLKKFISLKKNLKYVGLLPPMNVPSHVVSKQAVEGEIRKVKDGEVGLSKKVRKRGGYVLVTDSRTIRAVQYENVFYEGPRVRFVRSLDELEKGRFTVVGDRYGENFDKISSLLASKYEESGIRLIIGPPTGLPPDVLGYRVNFVMNQGVRDVRTEEALSIALAQLNSVL
ncbi:MAG: hypothetical protein RXQ70_06450 [Sulfolobaceae archaeon]|nr:hypothetical protein [Sulfolobales archaeon]